QDSALSERYYKNDQEVMGAVNSAFARNHPGTYTGDDAARQLAENAQRFGHQPPAAEQAANADVHAAVTQQLEQLWAQAIARSTGNGGGRLAEGMEWGAKLGRR